MENFGNYEIICEIGQGGMARVFKARQNDLKRTVAIKKIKEIYSEDKEFLRMFKDEAIIAANLNHPNIISIYELGKLSGSYYISMEYVNGESLKKVIDRSKILNEKIPQNLSLFVVVEIARALQFAHCINVIHRDVSPSNILISYEGKVKLVDFGIAKAEHFISVSTRSGILKGKLNYLAPEQARGEKVDHRTDIFALGIIMYELTTGKDLFTGETELEVLEKVRNVRAEDIITLLGGIQEDLKIIIVKCLQSKKEGRYQDILSLMTDIDNIVHSNGLLSNEGELGMYLTGLSGRGGENPQDEVNETMRRKFQDPEIIYQTRVDGGTGKVKTNRWKARNLVFVSVVVSTAFMFIFTFLKYGQRPSEKQSVASVEVLKSNKSNQNTGSSIKTITPKIYVGGSRLPAKTLNAGSSVIGNKENISGAIFINVNPANASVYVDNICKGEGNRVLKNLKPEEYIIKITHPDYEDEIRLVKITSEKQKIHLLYRNGEIQVQN